jgi:hypothetical protein
MNLINPIPHHVLIDLYSSVSHPEQKIKYLKSRGVLTSLIRGWYLNTGSSYSLFHIANHLYGPSYATGLSVLSYFGWIADKSTTIQSCVIKRGKEIKTEVGYFNYSSIPRELFHLGIMQFEVEKNIFCIVATPTKALYDHLVNTPYLSFSGKNDLLTYLEDDLRFDMDRLDQLDLLLLERLCTIGDKKRQVKILYNLIKQCKDDRAVA